MRHAAVLHLRGGSFRPGWLRSSRKPLASPAWPPPGAEGAAGVAATVVAAGCVFGPVVVSAAGASVLRAAVSSGSQAFAEAADDPVPAWSGVSGVH